MKKFLTELQCFEQLLKDENESRIEENIPKTN